MGRKPDFLIIGSMKAGTTSLHNYLNQHPEISATEPKEIHFFTEESFNEVELANYYNHFQSDKKLVGTSPQNYTKRHIKKFSGVPRRLKEYLPEIKLIYIVRDPLDRIESHYHEALAGGYTGAESLDAAIRADLKNNHFINTSKYYYQISAYLDYFEMEQICIVCLEDLKEDRLSEMNKIFTFLGVSNIYHDSLFLNVFNSASDKRAKTRINIILEKFYPKFFSKSIFRDLQLCIKNSALAKSILFHKVKRSFLSPSTRVLIIDELRSDIDEFRKLTGRTYSKWLI